MRLALIRHPKPLVAAGVCYGRLELDLHPEAEAQIALAVVALAGFAPEVVWASPERRCAAMAAALGAPRFDDRLLELNFGAWEGLAWDDVPRAALDRWAADPLGFAAPGGESGAALIARVSTFYADVRADGRDAVVVSHGGPLKVLRALASGRDVDLLAPALAMGAVVFVP